MHLKTGISMSNKGSSNSNGNSNSSPNMLKPRTLAADFDIDSEADVCGTVGGDRDRDDGITPIPGTGLWTGLSVSPLYAQSLHLSNVSVTSSPGQGSSTASYIDNILSPKATNREGPRHGHGQNDTVPENTRGETTARQQPSALFSPSSWVVVNNFPSVLESIKTPLLSLTSSLYAYVYSTPKISVRPTVKSPLVPDHAGDTKRDTQTSNITAPVPVEVEAE